MLETWPARIAAVVTAAVLAFAFVRGDAKVRTASLTYAFGWIGSLVVQDITNLTGIQPGFVVIDIVVLATLTALCWGARHPWVYWAAGIQLVAVLVHVFTLIDDRIGVTSYYWTLAVCSTALLMTIAWGALRSPD